MLIHYFPIMKRNAFLISLGKKIAEIRRSRGLSQEEAAYRADTSAKHLSDIERGLQNVSILTLKKIATALKVKTWELPPD